MDAYSTEFNVTEFNESQLKHFLVWAINKISTILTFVYLDQLLNALAHSFSQNNNNDEHYTINVNYLNK